MPSLFINAFNSWLRRGNGRPTASGAKAHVSAATAPVPTKNVTGDAVVVTAASICKKGVSRCFVSQRSRRVSHFLLAEGLPHEPDVAEPHSSLGTIARISAVVIQGSRSRGLQDFGGWQHAYRPRSVEIRPRSEVPGNYKRLRESE